MAAKHNRCADDVRSSADMLCSEQGFLHALSSFNKLEEVKSLNGVSLIAALEHLVLTFSRFKFQGYRIKPHEQLVSVSLTHYCASTSDLSTSWSRTTL